MKPLTKGVTFILTIILTIPLLFSFTGCSKQEPFEGEICKLEYQPAYTTTLLIPIIVSNGKTTTTILVPYIFYYPDRWYVQVRGIENLLIGGEKSGI